MRICWSIWYLSDIQQIRDWQFSRIDTHYYNIHPRYIRILAIAATHPNYMSYYEKHVVWDYLVSFVIKRKWEFVNFYDFLSKTSNFWKNLNMLYGVSYIPEKLIPWQSKWAWFHSSYIKFKVHYGCFLQLPRNWTQIWQSVLYLLLAKGILF